MSCIYASAHMSWGVARGSARHQARVSMIDTLTKTKSFKYLAGVWLRVDQREVASAGSEDGKVGLLDTFAYLEGLNIPYVISVKDRNFGSCEYSVPVSARVNSLGAYCSHGVRGPALWNDDVIDIMASEFDDFVRAYKNAGFKLLKEVHFGEIAYWPLSDRSTADKEAYVDNFVRLHQRAKDELDQLGIDVAAVVNWWGSSADNNAELRNVATRLLSSGIKLSCPDTAPGMFVDNDSDLQLPKVQALQLFEQIKNAYPHRVSPHIESYDMRRQDYGPTFKLLGDRLSTSRVLMSSVLSSRRDPRTIGMQELMSDSSIVSAIKEFSTKCFVAGSHDCADCETQTDPQTPDQEAPDVPTVHQPSCPGEAVVTDVLARVRELVGALDEAYVECRDDG